MPKFEHQRIVGLFCKILGNYLEKTNNGVVINHVEKKNLYERAGVKEYFIVNPANRNVTGFSLHEGSYQLMYQADGLFKSLSLDFEFYF